MHIALFILYGVLCSYGIRKIPFFRRTGLRPGILLLFFALHVAAGCLHNIIAWRYYPGHGDIWDSFQWSLLFRNWLHTDFHRFLLANSRWTYFTHNGIIFIQMLLDFFSFDNLYINTLLFAFPVFAGSTALFVAFRRHFPDDALVGLLAYLVPSTVFWTSCIFREGVLLMLLGCFFYQFTLKRSRRTILTIACSFLLIGYFRFTVAAFLVPALVLQYWVGHPRRYAFLPVAAAVAGVAIVCCIAFPAVPGFILWGLGKWQAEFQVLDGHSRLYLPAIDGSWSGLLRTVPYSVRNGLFEPLPGAGGRSIYLLFSIELALVWIVVAAAVLRTAFSRPASACRPKVCPDGFGAACMLFALLGMLAAGTIVPFAGAIVRYRSIYLPFLLAPALHALRRSVLLSRINSYMQNTLYFFI